MGLRGDWLDCILAVSDCLARSPLSDDWRGKGKGGDNMWYVALARFWFFVAIVAYDCIPPVRGEPEQAPLI